MADSSFNIQNYFKRGKTVVLTLRQGDPDEVRQWSDKDTSQLLSLMTSFLPEFRSNRRRKKEVWADVSKELSGEGYYWSPEDCRKKWSNMVRTFKGIQEQKSDPTVSNKRTKWPFFEYMYDLFSSEGAESLPEAVNVIQLLNNSGPPPSSPTAILSSKKDQNQTVDLVINPTVESANPQDLVGVAVDLASIINGAAGDEVTIVDTITHSDRTKSQPCASKSAISARVAHQGDDGVGSNDIEKRGGAGEVSQTQRNVNSGQLKTFLRTGLPGKRRRTVTKQKSTTETDTSADGLMERFLSMSKSQNEKILEQMTSFQDQALHVMQERNEVLKRLCSVLENNSASLGIQSSNKSNNVNSTLSTVQDSDSSGANHQISSSVAQSSIMSPYQFTTSGGATLAATTNSNGTITIGNLSETMIADTVAVVDPESLQTIMSQDGSGGITFHLDTPSDSQTSDSDARISADVKSLRLENIPSDVNLSAFSAALHPTLVSVVSSRKPRSSLSKVSVPLHTVNRKIAPRK